MSRSLPASRGLRRAAEGDRHDAACEGLLTLLIGQAAFMLLWLLARLHQFFDQATGPWSAWLAPLEGWRWAWSVALAAAMAGVLVGRLMCLTLPRATATRWLVACLAGIDAAALGICLVPVLAGTSAAAAGTADTLPLVHEAGSRLLLAWLAAPVGFLLVIYRVGAYVGRHDLSDLAGHLVYWLVVTCLAGGGVWLLMHWLLPRNPWLSLAAFVVYVAACLGVYAFLAGLMLHLREEMARLD